MAWMYEFKQSQKEPSKEQYLLGKKIENFETLKNDEEEQAKK